MSKHNQTSGTKPQQAQNQSEGTRSNSAGVTAKQNRQQGKATTPENPQEMGAGDAAASEFDATISSGAAMSSAGEDSSAELTLAGLIEQLKLQEGKTAEALDALLRAKAETENLRRRAREDVIRAEKFAAERFASELLAVKDSLEAALAVEQQDVEALCNGVELTLKQLQNAFTKANLTEVHPLGEKFDPHFHQAIGQLESAGEANRVVQVLQKGYVLHERVLRPALVMVSKASADR